MNWRALTAARRTRAGRGFSLLEILVAFVILALTLGTLYSVFSTGLRTVGVVEEYAEATRLAESLLTEAAGSRPIQTGQTKGQHPDAPYRWELTVNPVEIEPYLPSASEGLQALELEVRVVWPTGTGERELTIRTLRLQSPT